MYWDANASSTLRPCVLEGIGEFLNNYKVANPSSIHTEGRRARALLRSARENILKYLFSDRPETKASLIFTSGGTEACNSMIDGFLREEKEGHLLISTIEHPAVMQCVSRYEEHGFLVEKVGTNNRGIVCVEDFLKKIRPDTRLVALMFANNESGAIQPVLELAKGLRKLGYDGVIVSDTTQAISKSGITLSELFLAGVDALTISGHKLGALTGIGALILNQELTCRSFSPLIIGGGQEGKLRGGTEFLLGAHSLGLVCKYLREFGAKERENRIELTKKFIELIQKNIPDISILSPNIESGLCIDNTLFLRFKGCRADDLVVALDVNGISTSVGSACSSGKQEVSTVALEMGLSKEEARECIRISFDWDIKESDIFAGIKILASTVNNMREI